jgi:hypothetical protein
MGWPKWDSFGLWAFGFPLLALGLMKASSGRGRRKGLCHRMLPGVLNQREIFILDVMFEPVGEEG